MFQSTVKNINLKLNLSTQSLLRSCVKFSTISRNKYANIGLPNCICTSIEFCERQTFNRFNLRHLPIKCLSHGYADDASSIPDSKDSKIVFEDFSKHGHNLNEYKLDENDYDTEIKQDSNNHRLSFQHEDNEENVEERHKLNKIEYDLDENDYDTEIKQDLKKHRLSFQPENDKGNVEHRHNLNEMEYDLDENDYEAEIEQSLIDPQQSSEDDKDDIDSKIKLALEKLSSEEKLKILDEALHKRVEDDETEAHKQYSLADLEELMEDAANSLTFDNFEAKISEILHISSQIEKNKLVLLRRAAKWKSTWDFVSKSASLSLHMNSEMLVLLLLFLNRLGYHNINKVPTILQVLSFQMKKMQLKDRITLNHILQFYKLDMARHLIEKNVSQLEMTVDAQQLEDIKYIDLFNLLQICVERRLTCTYLVVEELNKRGLIRSPKLCLSFISKVALLPSRKFLKFMIPPEYEISLEMLTKACLSQMTSRIDVFPASVVYSIFIRLAQAICNGNEFFYHELFISAAIQRALNERWSTDKLEKIAWAAHQMNYVDDDLLRDLISRLRNQGHLETFPRLISAISVMRNVPSDVGEILKRHLKVPTVAELTNLHVRTMTAHLKKIMDLLNIGYICEKYCAAVLHESFIKKLVSVPSRKDLLLINFILRKEPSFRQICLSDEMKEELFQFVIQKLKALYNDGNDTNTYPLDNVANIINDPRQLVSRVSYKNQLFFDMLLVVDEQGCPVQLLDEVQTSDGSYLAYEDLNINPNHKRIVFMAVSPRRLIAPDRRLKSSANLFATTVESEGFNVVKCYHDQEDENVEQDLLNLGVNLSQ